MFLDDLCEMKGVKCIARRTTTELPNKLSYIFFLFFPFTCKILFLHFQLLTVSHILHFNTRGYYFPFFYNFYRLFYIKHTE